jgi:DNA (cytosine-5)-methyltransferase 1
MKLAISSLISEIDKYAASTYKNNLGDESLVLKDIQSIHVNEIPEFDVLVAGFPCQSFSTAGRQRGFNDC